MLRKFRTHLLRFWNFWPPFLGTGIKITKQSNDYRYIQVKLKLRFWNANYVGTQFGGAIAMMADPFYMVMLLRNLGREYIVWDKTATIRYLKPGKTDLFAEFILTQEEIDEIRTLVDEQEKIDWIRIVEIKDKEGAVIATVSKTIYIRKKQ